MQTLLNKNILTILKRLGCIRIFEILKFYADLKAQAKITCQFLFRFYGLYLQVN